MTNITLDFVDYVGHIRASAAVIKRDPAARNSCMWDTFHARYNINKCVNNSRNVVHIKHIQIIESI
jgi:hypothetical protein